MPPPTASTRAGPTGGRSCWSAKGSRPTAQRSFRRARGPGSSTPSTPRSGWRPSPVAGDLADEAFEHALLSLRRNVTPLGFTAASLDDNVLMDHDANYAAVWARDGIMSGLWAMALDDPGLDATFRRTLEVLGAHQTPSGQIPAYVRIHGEVPDYSGIGGIASIDSVLWWVIGVARYSLLRGDRAFAEAMYPGVERAMSWLAAHDSNNDGLLEIPESSDWMDLFPRSYNVLYDEVLWYRACRDGASLSAALSGDPGPWGSAGRRGAAQHHRRLLADRGPADGAGRVDQRPVLHRRGPLPARPGDPFRVLVAVRRARQPARRVVGTARRRQAAAAVPVPVGSGDQPAVPGRLHLPADPLGSGRLEGLLHRQLPQPARPLPQRRCMALHRRPVGAVPPRHRPGGAGPP